MSGSKLWVFHLQYWGGGGGGFVRLRQRYLRYGLILEVLSASFGTYPRGYYPQVVGSYRVRIELELESELEFLFLHCTHTWWGYKEECFHHSYLWGHNRARL